MLAPAAGLFRFGASFLTSRSASAGSIAADLLAREDLVSGPSAGAWVSSLVCFGDAGSDPASVEGEDGSGNFKMVGGEASFGGAATLDYLADWVAEEPESLTPCRSRAALS